MWSVRRKNGRVAHAAPGIGKPAGVVCRFDNPVLPSGGVKGQGTILMRGPVTSDDIGQRTYLMRGPVTDLMRGPGADLMRGPVTDLMGGLIIEPVPGRSLLRTPRLHQKIRA